MYSWRELHLTESLSVTPSIFESSLKTMIYDSEPPLTYGGECDSESIPIFEDEETLPSEWLSTMKGTLKRERKLKI